MKASIVKWVVAYPVVLHRGEEFGRRICGRCHIYDTKEEAERFVDEHISWCMERTLQKVYTDSRGYMYYYYDDEHLGLAEIKLYPVMCSLDVQVESSRVYYPNVSEL